MSQYVSFDILSESVTASQVTAALGIEPDSIRVKASRAAEPPRPRHHHWLVECRRPLAVDEQIVLVLARLQPVAQRIRTLVDEHGVSAELQVVRNFDDPEGADEVSETSATGLERLPGQHQLLGWHLDRTLIDFLHAAGAELDVDEYG